MYSYIPNYITKIQDPSKDESLLNHQQQKIKAKTGHLTKTNGKKLKAALPVKSFHSFSLCLRQCKDCANLIEAVIEDAL